MSSKSLAELVCSVYRDAGTPPLPTGKKVKPRLWTRPPLYTHLTLLDEPLQPFLEVMVGRTLDEMVDVYEQFVAGYLVAKEFDMDSTGWLGRMLGMSARDSRMLFAPAEGRRAHLFANLIQFAALVSYNVSSTRSTTADSFVVTTAYLGYRFGVRDGTFISNVNYAEPQKQLDLRVYNGSLWDLPRTAAVKRKREITIHDQLSYWALQQPQAEELLLALRILWWRSRTSSTARFEQMFKPEIVTPTAEAITAARVALDSDNPLDALREVFVHMPIAEFIRRFASPYRKLKLPLSEEMRQKFEFSLSELAQ